MIRAATSRTCPTEPGRAGQLARACSVCTESITQTSGRSALERREHRVEVGLGEDRDVERARRGAAPRRSARRRICAADSSPLT